MYEEVILVGNKCDYDRKSWEVDTQTGKEVKLITPLHPLTPPEKNITLKWRKWPKLLHQNLKIQEK